MQGHFQATPKFNLIQATVRKFYRLVTPIYCLLPKEIRQRHNFKQIQYSDSLILACMLTRIDLRESSETHFHQMLVASVVPVPERSRYNRRCRKFVKALELIRFFLLKRYCPLSTYTIIDSAPITLDSTRRSNRAKVLVGIADKGYNATKGTYYFGFKLHAVMADNSYFVNWELTPASVDDRKVVEECKVFPRFKS